MVLTLGWAERKMCPSLPFKDSFESGWWLMLAVLNFPMVPFLQTEDAESPGRQACRKCFISCSMLMLPNRTCAGCHQEALLYSCHHPTWWKGDGFHCTYAKDTSKLPPCQADEVTTLFCHPAGNWNSITAAAHSVPSPWVYIALVPLRTPLSVLYSTPGVSLLEPANYPFFPELTYLNVSALPGRPSAVVSGAPMLRLLMRNWPEAFPHIGVYLNTLALSV